MIAEYEIPDNITSCVLAQPGPDPMIMIVVGLGIGLWVGVWGTLIAMRVFYAAGDDEKK